MISEVTYFGLSFEKCILKIGDVCFFKMFFKWKYITGFKKFWGNFVIHDVSKFLLTWSDFKKNVVGYQNWQILAKEIAN